VSEGPKISGGRRRTSQRRLAWSAAASLLLLPLVAMQFTDEVKWDGFDFALLAAMLIAAGGTVELALMRTGNGAYRAAVVLATTAAFLLVWVNLAVGVIGSEGNPANLMYGGVLIGAVVGAVVTRFQPLGMARAMAATAGAQTLIGTTALISGWGSTSSSFPEAIILLTGFFAVLWLLSACSLEKLRERSPYPADPHEARGAKLVLPPGGLITRRDRESTAQWSRRWLGHFGGEIAGHGRMRDD
jgi:hypothetical protein